MRSEQDIFEEEIACLNDDLGRAHTTLDEAGAREHEAIAECQHALKVFKSKKYKEGYGDRKRGVSLKYSPDIGSFLRGEGHNPLEGSASHAAGGGLSNPTI